MNKFIHKIQHKFGWYKGTVVSKVVGDEKIMIGFCCSYCGETEWHDATSVINETIKEVVNNVRLVGKPGVK